MGTLAMVDSEEKVLDPKLESEAQEMALVESEERVVDRKASSAAQEMVLVISEEVVVEPKVDSAAQETATVESEEKVVDSKADTTAQEMAVAESEEKVVEPKVDSAAHVMQQKAGRQQGEKKRKKETVFRYGNYHRYYGYRLGKTADEDPRLKCFRREWFEGKDCLDIGCNEGFVTISIAQKYMCQSILGVDIDNDSTRGIFSDSRRPAMLRPGSPFLKRVSIKGLRVSVELQKAVRNLQGEAAASDSPMDGFLEEDRLLETGVLRPCDDTGEKCNEREENEVAPEMDKMSSSSGSDSLLNRVKFKREQFIEDFPDGDFMKDGMFDTILCLSVTKWIHLNWGDKGLVRLFAKIYRLLRKGGILILEPQPWKSYQSKYFVSETTRECFRKICLTPGDFKEVLLDKIGFKSVEEVSQAVPNSSLGFGRSLFLYVK